MAQNFFNQKGTGQDLRFSPKGPRIYADKANTKFELYSPTGVVGNPADLIQLEIAEPQNPYDAVNIKYLPSRKPVRFVSKNSLTNLTNISLAVLNSALDDGTVSAAVGDRVLLNAQNGSTADPENGIYDVVANGPNVDLVRAPDLDEDLEVYPGQTVAVYAGPDEQDTLWMLTTPDATSITIGTTGLLWQKISSTATGNFVVDGINLGGGEEVFESKSGSDLQFRTLVAGANVTLSTVGNTIQIDAGTGPGAGEANTASNIGTGVGVFNQKTGVNLEFKSLTGGTGISLDDTTIPGEIIINSTVSSQNLFETFNADTGSVTAASATDSLSIVGGSFISTSITGNTLTIDGVGIGGPVEILDEGSTLTSAVTSIDFVGPGVTATNVGGDVTVTISGGGSGSPLEVQDSAVSVDTDVVLMDFTGLITATQTSPGNVEIDVQPQTSVNEGSGVGIGNGLDVNNNLLLKSLTAGTNITLDDTTNPGEIIINASGGGPGGSLEVQEEGSAVDSNVDTINFIGSAVTAVSTATPGTVNIEVTADDTQGSNVGTGTYQIFRDKTGSTLNFKTLEAGANVTISEVADTITIAASTGGPGSGEINDGLNLGTGEEVFAGKAGFDLQFKTLVAGPNVTLSSTANEITIEATTGPGSTQNLFETVVGDTGPGIVASTATDTLNIIGGTNVTTNVVGGQLVIDAIAVGGSPVEILDEGGSLTTSVSSINFVGAGVTATTSVDDVTVTIPDATQNLYETITADVGGPSPAGNPNDTLNILGGTGLETSLSGNTLTINYVGGAGADQLLYSVVDGDSGGPVNATTATDTIQFIGTGGASTVVSQSGNITTVEINSASGGSPITAQDEGTTLTTGMQLINFVGTGVTATQPNPNEIRVEIPAAPGGGEANTASNLGTGEGVFASKVAQDLQFKSLVAGTDISITSSPTEITINSTVAPQNLYESFTDGTNTTTADSPTDTMTVNGNDGIGVVISNDTIDIEADVDGVTITNQGGTGDQLAVRGGGGSPEVLVSQGPSNDAVFQDVNDLVFAYNRINDEHGGVALAAQGGEAFNFAEGDGMRIDVTSAPDTITIAYDHTRLWNASSDPHATFVDTDITNFVDPDRRNASNGGTKSWHEWAVQMGTSHDGTVSNREAVLVVESDVANNKEYMIITHGFGGTSFNDEVRIEATNDDHIVAFVSDRDKDQIDARIQPRGPDGSVYLHESFGPGIVTSDESHDLTVIAGKTDKVNPAANLYLVGGDGDYYTQGGDVIVRAGPSKSDDPGIVRVRSSFAHEEDIILIDSQSSADTLLRLRHGTDVFEQVLEGNVDTNIDLTLEIPVNSTGVNNIGDGPTTGLYRAVNDVEYNTAFEPHDLTTQLDAFMLKRSFEPMDDAVVRDRCIYGFVDQTGSAGSKIISNDFEGTVMSVRLRPVTTWGALADVSVEASGTTTATLMDSSIIDPEDVNTTQHEWLTEDITGTGTNLSLDWTAGGTGRMEYYICYIGTKQEALSD